VAAIVKNIDAVTRSPEKINRAVFMHACLSGALASWQDQTDGG
jgi:hypothetical protein